MPTTLNEWLWSMAYVGPVAFALCAGAVVLFLNRRKAPKAAVVGAGTLLGVLVTNGLMWFRSEWLVYDFRTSGVVSSFVWQLRVMAVMSAVLHAVAVGLLVWAILAGRGKPAESSPSDES
jgi:hypothetical protein